MRNTCTPACQPSVLYAATGAICRRPGPVGELRILVARPRLTIGNPATEWVSGLVRLHALGTPNVVHLLDGRRVVLGALMPERALDSFQADLLVEAAVREAEIEHEVEVMLADPQAAIDLFAWAADFVPDPA